MSLDSMWNFFLIIFGFGLLIGIHELGHFLAAKWAGIRTNAFAIGMGPVFCSYRSGIGFSYGSSKNKVITKFGKDAAEMSDEELRINGISETEYSLRYLPIGGFVSMLGQEDGKPDMLSEDPRSYNKCPVGKRMVVVSAGVCMNVLLAIALFLVCFQVGVRFEAPVVGHIIPGSPAARAVSLGDNPTRLQPSDVIVSIDQKPVSTFTDVQIAGAMAKPGVPIVLAVKRAGEHSNLKFSITPESVTQDGLLELGLFPASSLTIRQGAEFEESLEILQEQYPSLAKIGPGVTLTSPSYSNWEEFKSSLSGVMMAQGWADDAFVRTEWSNGHTIDLPVFPELNILRPAGIPSDSLQNFEMGYMGLVPLSKVSFVLDTSPNEGVLQKGDVITRVDSLGAPRMGQLRNYLANREDGDIDLTVLRGDDEIEIVAKLHEGKLGVLLANALNVPRIAQPLKEVLVDIDGELIVSSTAIAESNLQGGDWCLDCWSGLQNEIAASFSSGTFEKSVFLTIVDSETEAIRRVELRPSEEELSDVASSGLATPLSQQMFEPVYVIRSSGGNPIKAIKMGVDETINMIVMTYLTVDRLFRRTVGVEQLRGPIGIVDIGFKIADRGMSYLLFFLAIISVNLAVLNFLPLPIVDGGLFLYLIYEKVIGRPPSVAFQNVAAMLGIGLLGTLFVVTFYNDIMRIVG